MQSVGSQDRAQEAGSRILSEASGGLLASKCHAGASGFGGELALFVVDVAIDDREGAAVVDDFAFGSDASFEDGSDEVHFQLDRGAGFAFLKHADVGEADDRIGDGGNSSSVEIAHGVEDFGRDFEGEFGAAGRDRDELDAEGFA